VFVALGIQHAKRMCLIVICHLSGFADVSTLSHKGQDFQEKKVTELKKCVLIFSANLSEIFFIPRKISRDMIIKVYVSPCKVPVILVRF
jgi:hypothetical protein